MEGAEGGTEERRGQEPWGDDEGEREGRGRAGKDETGGEREGERGRALRR